MQAQHALTAAQDPRHPPLSSTPEQEILSQLPVGVVVVDRCYHIQTINNAAQRLLCIHGAALGEDLIHLAHAVPAAPLRAAIDAAFSGAAPGSLHEVVTVDPATAEERYLQISCHPRSGAQQDEPVATTMILVTDITSAVHERHALEQAYTSQRAETERVEATLRRVADNNRRLLAANRTPAAARSDLCRDNATAAAGAEEAQAVTEDVARLQDEFLTLAGHELRTPLTAVQSCLELLGQRLPPESGDTCSRQFARLALRHARRLTALVRDLTDAARLQSGKLVLSCEAVDLVALAAQAVDTAQVLATDQTVHLEADDTALLVCGDAVRLEQVLLNLLTNAITHAPDAARIDVRLRRVDDTAQLQVQDDGYGIAAAALPHLFTRFYQVARPDRPSQGGLGLGLFICKELVTAHGGRIDVRSMEGEGTTFMVWLPLLDDHGRLA